MSDVAKSPLVALSPSRVKSANQSKPDDLNYYILKNIFVDNKLEFSKVQDVTGRQIYIKITNGNAKPQHDDFIALESNMLLISTADKHDIIKLLSNPELQSITGLVVETSAGIMVFYNTGGIPRDKTYSYDDIILDYKYQVVYPLITDNNINISLDEVYNTIINWMINKQTKQLSELAILINETINNLSNFVNLRDKYYNKILDTIKTLDYYRNQYSDELLLDVNEKTKYDQLLYNMKVRNELMIELIKNTGDLVSNRVQIEHINNELITNKGYIIKNIDKLDGVINYI